MLARAKKEKADRYPDQPPCRSFLVRVLVIGGANSDTSCLNREETFQSTIRTLCS